MGEIEIIQFFDIMDCMVLDSIQDLHIANICCNNSYTTWTLYHSKETRPTSTKSSEVLSRLWNYISKELKTKVKR
jgi:hypothetical protein